MRYLKNYKLFENNNIEYIRMLISNHKLKEFIDEMDILYKNSDFENINQTLIMTANYCDYDMTKILIDEYKADVNCIDNESKYMKLTPLIRTSDIDIMKLLLENGANVNHCSSNGKNILIYEASYSDSNTNDRIIFLLDLFLQYDIDLNMKDNDGYDFLDYLEKDKQDKILSWLDENYPDEYFKYMKNKNIEKFNI